MTRLAAILLLLLAAASPAVAQIVTGASASLEMRDSLTVSSARPMQPSGEDTPSQVRVDEGAYEISGDPNRFYRVRTDIAEGAAATVIRSSNTGEISEGGLALLDKQGRDTIRIEAAPSAGGERPSVAIAIDYE